MRRRVAIVLATLFSWMLILPAFAPSAEAKLPACCRKAGKHKCAMGVVSAETSGAAVAAIGEKCPCFLHSTAGAHVEGFAPPLQATIFAGIVRLPAVSSQTESGYRSSHLRSKQKRGPPSFFLS